LDLIATSDFFKVDDELGLVFGFAIICKDESGEDYFDTQGDHVPEDSMLTASTDFMLNERAGKVMHCGDAVGKVVFAWPLTTEIAKTFGIETKRTGLMIAWKPNDKATLKRFKEGGDLKGFSIGGSYGTVEELADA
jgi:hypothetical protein